MPPRQTKGGTDDKKKHRQEKKGLNISAFATKQITLQPENYYETEIYGKENEKEPPLGPGPIVYDDD